MISNYFQRFPSPSSSASTLNTFRTNNKKSARTWKAMEILWRKSRPDNSRVRFRFRVLTMTSHRKGRANGKVSLNERRSESERSNKRRGNFKESSSIVIATREKTSFSDTKEAITQLRKTIVRESAELFWKTCNRWKENWWVPVAILLWIKINAGKLF